MIQGGNTCLIVEVPNGYFDEREAEAKAKAESSEAGPDSPGTFTVHCGCWDSPRVLAFPVAFPTMDHWHPGADRLMVCPYVPGMTVHVPEQAVRKIFLLGRWYGYVDQGMVIASEGGES